MTTPTWLTGSPGDGHDGAPDELEDFLDQIEAEEPAGVILELVRGYGSPKLAEKRRYLRNEITGMGYNLASRVMDERDYGAPTSRKRYVIWAVRADVRPAVHIPRRGRRDLSGDHSPIHQAIMAANPLGGTE